MAAMEPAPSGASCAAVALAVVTGAGLQLRAATTQPEAELQAPCRPPHGPPGSPARLPGSVGGFCKFLVIFSVSNF